MEEQKKGIKEPVPRMPRGITWQDVKTEECPSRNVEVSSHK